MALERKPASPDGNPAYPDAEEYSADRRGFLAMIGVVAAGAAGYFAYKSFSAQPKAMPQGDVAPIMPASTPTPPATATPAAAAQGNVAPALADPQAAAPGNVAEPLPAPQPPVANPQSQVEGGVKAVAPQPKQNPNPPAEPQAQPLGDVKAMPNREPVEPKANARGGASLRTKRTSRGQA